MYYEKIHTETAAGFDIVFSVMPEDSAPDWFESKEEESQFWKDLDSGHTSYFVARVQAIKNGIILGEDYLGGCCYESPLQFVNASDYYGGMVESAVEEAKRNIAALCEGVTQ